MSEIVTAKIIEIAFQMAMATKSGTDVEWDNTELHEAFRFHYTALHEIVGSMLLDPKSKMSRPGKQVVKSIG